MQLQPRSIAIVPGRRRVRLNFALQLELGDAPQVLAQDFFLDFELVLVAGVLVMASAATGIIRTRWLNAVRRRFHDCFGVGACESGFFFGECGFDFLSGENERNEYGLAASEIFTNG